jgi:molybdopterin-guanine dinucleotide biosynthesis adapter protein
MTCKMMAFVGRSGSGKTTLITRIIPELIKRNLRVGTIKHTHHAVTFDTQGKDSWKHRQAGSEQVMLYSETEMAFFAKTDHKLSLEEMKEKWFSDCDILIIEGFKNAPVFKVEVCRVENPKSPLYIDPSFSIDALVTDAVPPFPVPHFTFDELDKLIEWLCKKLDLNM